MQNMLMVGFSRPARNAEANVAGTVEISLGVFLTLLNPSLEKISQTLKTPQRAEKMGISKSPIREVLDRLKREGSVHTLSSKGRFVAKLPRRTRACQEKNKIDWELA
jgi:biotin operon repressor